jgi:hypothetical protein
MLLLGNTGFLLRLAQEASPADRKLNVAMDQTRALDLLRRCQADVLVLKQWRGLLCRVRGNQDRRVR